MVGEAPAAGRAFDNAGSFELAQGDTEAVVAYPQRGAQGLAREGAASAAQAGEEDAPGGSVRKSVFLDGLR